MVFDPQGKAGTPGRYFGDELSAEDQGKGPSAKEVRGSIRNMAIRGPRRLEPEISTGEIRQAARDTLSRKAVGPGQIPAGFIRAAIAELFDRMIGRGLFPKELRRFRIHSVQTKKTENEKMGFGVQK